jgi:hypothetical protein
MHDRLRAAIEPALRDVHSTAALVIRVEDREWADRDDQPGAFLRYADGSGMGVSVWLPDSDLEQAVSVADQVQEFVVEGIGGTRSNWPVCPEHPMTHPLAARAVDGEAQWVCPMSGTPVAAVGSLPA